MPQTLRRISFRRRLATTSSNRLLIIRIRGLVICSHLPLSVTSCWELNIGYGNQSTTKQGHYTIQTQQKGIQRGNGHRYTKEEPEKNSVRQEGRGGSKEEASFGEMRTNRLRYRFNATEEHTNDSCIIRVALHQLGLFVNTPYAPCEGCSRLMKSGLRVYRKFPNTGEEFQWQMGLE